MTWYKVCRSKQNDPCTERQKEETKKQEAYQVLLPKGKLSQLSGGKLSAIKATKALHNKNC